MLRNHLSQEHDWASRRLDIIERHVACIDRLLNGQKSRILDFGCGPGLYTHRLARLGHACTGVDFSPASIDYAKEAAAGESLQISYELRDLREFVPDGRFDLVMMLFGEFNVFPANEALGLLKAAFASLKDDGHLLIEVSTFDSILADGKLPPTWEPLNSGLFSDNPHLYLQEHFWDEVETSATARYTIIDAQTGEVTEYGSTTKAYHERQYLAALAGAGFGEIRKLAETEWPPGEMFLNGLQTYYCSRARPRSSATG
jgi:SAM-dependent methyltransferase